jgi:hypothetical protein
MKTSWNRVYPALPWLRRLVPGLSPPRPEFTPGSFHVRFVVDKAALAVKVAE